MSNTYKILPTNSEHFPFAIICGETFISAHQSREQAEAVREGYYKGDKAARK